MEKVISAGGVIIQNGKILFVKLSHVGKITFPKGHVEPGETYEDTALREVTEETGYTEIRIIKKLGVVTKPSVEKDGTRITKDVHLYLMKITGNSMSKTPPEEETIWLTFDESLNLLVPQEVTFLESIKNELE